MAVPRTKILSWQLWNAIFRHHWLQHPVYTRVFKSGKYDTDRLTRREAVMLSLLAGVLLVMIFLSIENMPIWALMFLFMSGTISGVVISWRIVRALHREYAEHRYEVISVSPPGITGFHWSQVTRVMMDDRKVFWMRWLTMGCYSLLLFPTLALLLPFLLIMLQGGGETFLMLTGLYVMVMSLFFIDYIQSVLTAVLLAITLTSGFKDPSQALLQVISLFGVVQLTSYLLYGVMAWLYFGQIIVPLLMTGQLFVAMVLAPLYPLTLFAMREASLRWGCRIAENRYGLQFSLIGLEPPDHSKGK